ncbi:bifunctional 5,10-methylenetetrahydrofolate dehydrogenase/5,10-methenyltetrahydrofolate cyclohydrolase [Collinsella sp. zg1085]|uniref:bifunctional 5,10-methylenetetrahydrofolate dehydrogenase/5,10-methenyltetrahydrofolate cyclohydrolase n=1 Tax=Collinsella sp. zg1085 TaxID=2844380 RepID=UPI001C0C92B7|nr:bifunctional 5,10-methylenetetrahydrofolate dehydrogenase/5,10-methenyltetrahydrofolate cyclohydrolase [Collinsella sp. zg1085]QWT18209.1 bifunctional 5,10-methylenetetrahydrofolate dehydrogenase/5,10-methenyltetrahydrofolate cyclohydrolase [Collinsella sp. zg1085]
MTEILRGAPVAHALEEQLAARIQHLQTAGIQPCLVSLRVGERVDDIAYERSAARRAEKNGLITRQIVLPEQVSEHVLLETIMQINDDPLIHGCLILRPLPSHIDETRICAALKPEKDIDGITPSSLYAVFAHQNKGFAPATPAAVMKALDHYQCDVAGKHVVLIGRSLVVGRPLSMLLQAAHATVTMCHSRTQNLKQLTQEADILIVAAGHARMIDASHVRAGQTLIDVGINWDKSSNKLVGDLDFEAVEALAGAVTPVPGGIGAITTAVLIEHVVQAAERIHASTLNAV